MGFGLKFFIHALQIHQLTIHRNDNKFHSRHTFYEKQLHTFTPDILRFFNSNIIFAITIS